MAKAYYRQSNKYTYSSGQSLPLKTEKVKKFILDILHQVTVCGQAETQIKACLQTALGEI